MKIRMGFVTNSSSTSFILITRNGFRRDVFMRLMGLQEGSPLAPIFEELYDGLTMGMYPIQQYRWRDRDILTTDWVAAVAKDFSPEVAEKVRRAVADGHEAYAGGLSSDDSPVEAFFCVDSFEVDGDDMYLNYLQCVW